jgi:hypothetical protein
VQETAPGGDRLQPGFAEIALQGVLVLVAHLNKYSALHDKTRRIERDDAND